MTASTVCLVASGRSRAGGDDEHLSLAEDLVWTQTGDHAIADHEVGSPRR